MSDLNEIIENNEFDWVSLRFTDTRGKEHHITIPKQEFNKSLLQDGKMFDGSSINGWKGINESDMILIPDISHVTLDPFTETPTLIVRCDIVDPITLQNYERDPRSIAKRAEDFLKSTKIADTAYLGPEPEFFVFDSARWQIDISGSSYKIESEEAAWSSNSKELPSGLNLGHRPTIKGGYFPVPPVDSLHEARTKMCEAMTEMGLEVEVHHHEVGTAGQCEIGTRFNTLTRKADEVQMLKYAVMQTADFLGKTATFMPKPLVGDNGSGMHVHISLAKNGANIFNGNGYAGLSNEALFFIGGIIKHAKAINAFANASTNSYKRLIPGFEAPVMLAYSSRNRSAAIRIPHIQNSQARRIEVRFPDPTANPYLLFASLIMAGIDGIRNKIHPGDPADKDLYDLPPEETYGLPQVAESLEEALVELDKDRAFLTAGDVFSNDMIDAYIELKKAECIRVSQVTHPAEFELYYSL
jgi:glutamine synthetase